MAINAKLCHRPVGLMNYSVVVLVIIRLKFPLHFQPFRQMLETHY